MQIRLIWAGKTKPVEINKLIERYLERLSRYVRVAIHEIKAEKISKNISPSLIKNKEAERILKFIDNTGKLLVWDQRGKQLNSLEFAFLLKNLEAQGIPVLWNVIGGPLGLAPHLIRKANHVLSLSIMTFPHDLARLLVVEQLYRAYSILHGSPYHRE